MWIGNLIVLDLLKICGKSSNNILSNGGFFHGDEFHGIPIRKNHLKKTNPSCLVGGWTNPLETYYCSQIGSYPQGSVWNLQKNIWSVTTYLDVPGI